MPFRSAGAFFAQLIPSILSDLKRIARRSEGEVTVDDLQSEAWLVADEIGRGSNATPDPTDKVFHQQILGRLYNRFVKFADKRLRFAVRLDEKSRDEDGGEREGAIAAALAAPDTYEPSLAMESSEGEGEREAELRRRFAEAVAYVRLFANLKNDQLAVCEHLSVTAGTLRSRLYRAEEVLKRQPSLFDGIAAIHENFMPPRAVSMYIKARGKCGMQFGAQGRLPAGWYVPIRQISA